MHLATAGGAYRVSVFEPADEPIRISQAGAVEPSLEPLLQNCLARYERRMVTIFSLGGGAVDTTLRPLAGLSMRTRLHRSINTGRRG